MWCVVAVQAFFHPLPCFLPTSSRSWLPSQTNALQPGCLHPRQSNVPSATSRPATAQRSTCATRLPSPASVQPGLCRTTTAQDGIMYRDPTHSATLHLLQHFPAWQMWNSESSWRLLLSHFIHVVWWKVKMLIPLGSCCMDLKYTVWWYCILLHFYISC